jgi:ATP-binding cassette subfamily D (ALD) protein 3
MGIYDSVLTRYGAHICAVAVLALPVFGPRSAEYMKRSSSDPSVITRDYIRNFSLIVNLGKAIGRLVVSYKDI